MPKQNNQNSSAKPSSATPSPAVTAASKATPTTNAPPSTLTIDSKGFKQWRIQTLADVSTVDEYQMDKCLHFLSHLIRKCRILKRRLIEFTYHEQGRIVVTMQDIETGDIIVEPKQPEDDPLS